MHETGHWKNTGSTTMPGAWCAGGHARCPGWTRVHYWCHALMATYRQRSCRHDTQLLAWDKATCRHHGPGQVDPSSHSHMLLVLKYLGSWHSWWQAYILGRLGSLEVSAAPITQSWQSETLRTVSGTLQGERRGKGIVKRDRKEIQR